MIKKKFYKTKSTCDVTFELPKEIKAEQVALAGDFNDWNPAATPLKKVKGVWKTTLKLDLEREYQYRYILNDGQWINDHKADKYVPNHIDGDNSVVVTSKN